MSFISKGILGSLLLVPIAGVRADDLTRWARELESRGIQLSCEVVELDTGRSVFSRNAGRPLAPASTMKLVTTAAAFELLSPEGLLDTEVYLGGPVEDGCLKGPLWFVGKGDPGLQEPFLDGDPGAIFERVGARLRELGVSVIEGDLILDARAFDSAVRHPDWPGNTLPYADGAPLTALSIEGACLSIGFAMPGSSGRRRVLVRPAGTGIELIDRTRSGAGAVWNAVLRGSRCTVTGTVPARGAVLSMRYADPEPIARYGAVVRHRLGRAGLELRGRVAMASGERPAGELALRFGSNVARLVRHINKESLNHPAGCLWKHLGYRLEDVGTFASGARAARHALLKLGIAESVLEGCLLEDGAGLARSNRLSAHLFTQLLQRAAQRPWGELLRLSLPLAGRDGTLEGRLRHPQLVGRVQAKTGYLAGVGALAGYVETPAGRRLAFAILASFPRRQGGWYHDVIQPAQERLLAMIVGRYRESSP